MPREYLRKSFDIFRISGNKILLDDAENHRIENSINLLDDILCLDFATFLKINELTVNHSTSGEIVLQLVLDSTINLVKFHNIYFNTLLLLFSSLCLIVKLV